MSITWDVLPRVVQLNNTLNIVWEGQIPALLSDISLEKKSSLRASLTRNWSWLTGSNQDTPVMGHYVCSAPALALRTHLHIWPLPQFLLCKTSWDLKIKSHFKILVQLAVNFFGETFEQRTLKNVFPFRMHYTLTDVMK